MSLLIVPPLLLSLVCCFSKTIQVVLFLAHLRRHQVFGPFLIVAPLGTLPAWKTEFARWTPDVPVLIYHGDKATRAGLRKQFAAASNPDATFPIVLTNYEMSMNDAPFLKKVHWKMLVVDEGQQAHMGTRCRERGAQQSARCERLTLTRCRSNLPIDLRLSQATA